MDTNTEPTKVEKPVVVKENVKPKDNISLGLKTKLDQIEVAKKAKSENKPSQIKFGDQHNPAEEVKKCEKTQQKHDDVNDHNKKLIKAYKPNKQVLAEKNASTLFKEENKEEAKSNTKIITPQKKSEVFQSANQDDKKTAKGKQTFTKNNQSDVFSTEEKAPSKLSKGNFKNEKTSVFKAEPEEAKKTLKEYKKQTNNDVISHEKKEILEKKTLKEYKKKTDNDVITHEKPEIKTSKSLKIYDLDKKKSDVITHDVKPLSTKNERKSETNFLCGWEGAEQKVPQSARYERKTFNQIGSDNTEKKVATKKVNSQKYQSSMNNVFYDQESNSKPQHVVHSQKKGGNNPITSDFKNTVNQAPQSAQSARGANPNAGKQTFSIFG